MLYGLFRVVLFFTSDNVTECFELQKLHADFISKGRRDRASFILTWDSFNKLRSRESVIAKWGSFFVLKSGSSSITK